MRIKVVFLLQCFLVLTLLVVYCYSAEQSLSATNCWRCWHVLAVLSLESIIILFISKKKIILRFYNEDRFISHQFSQKELSLWHKIKYLNLNIHRTRCCKSLIFQTQIIWSHRIHSLKYLRSATFGSKDTVIRKSEFVAKTQFLWPLIY